LIYPNPVRDELFVDSSVEQVEIFNSLGMLVISQGNLEDEGVDVSILSDGVYYAVLTGRSKKWVRRVVVCR
jgi:hypothetical protein